VFRWAAEAELIPGVPNFGPEFKKPGRSETRRGKAQQAATTGRKDFKADEVRQLLAKSKGCLKACILLGINAGFGNSDCARLREDHIDFESAMCDLPRQKSGILRQFFAWQKTRDAIRDAMNERPIAKVESDDSLCLLTSHGRPVFWESVNGEKRTVSRCDNVGKEFTKLVKDCGIRRARGLYSLRRNRGWQHAGSSSGQSRDGAQRCEYGGSLPSGHRPAAAEGRGQIR
jgi:integrase